MIWVTGLPIYRINATKFLLIAACYSLSTLPLCLPMFSKHSLLDRKTSLYFFDRCQRDPLDFTTLQLLPGQLVRIVRAVPFCPNCCHDVDFLSFFFSSTSSRKSFFRTSPCISNSIKTNKFRYRNQFEILFFKLLLKVYIMGLETSK